MSISYNNLYQILTLFILFNVTSTNSLVFTPQNDQDLVSLACKHTLYQDICISTLTSDPRTKACSDLNGLASIALDQTLTQAKETQRYIKDLIKSRESSNNNDSLNFKSSSLSDCEEEYGEAVDDMRDAARALRGGDYASVNELVSGAMTECDTCLDGSEEEIRGFSGSSSKDENMSSFVDKNQYFYKMCSNVLAIVKLLG